jgi:hypothetical protein
VHLGPSVLVVKERFSHMKTKHIFSTVYCIVSRNRLVTEEIIYIYLFIYFIIQCVFTVLV